MKATLNIAAVVLALFGLITLFMSGSVIFDLFGIRAREGNYVLFVVVSNFVSGFLYMASAYGMFFQKKWATALLVVTSIILLLSFAGLLWHINSGRVYEQQTVFAMIFRLGITILFSVLSWRLSEKKLKNKMI